MRANSWTQEDINKLKELYPDHSNAHIGSILNRSMNAVSTYAKRLKLRKKIGYVRQTKWTSEKDERLKNIYHNHGTNQITELLEVSKSSIYLRAIKLHLGEKQNKGRYSKGHVPANKGKKGVYYPGMENTWFQKGHIPHNTKFDGCISIRKDTESGIFYKYIRISLGKWIMYQHYLYAQKHGPLPQDKILRCIDGDQLNCDPDNWEPISMNTHLDRNLGRSDISDKYALLQLSKRDPQKRIMIQKYMPELIKLKRSQLKLKRTINGK